MTKYTPKQLKFIQIRQLLYAFYQHNGYPAGCSIDAKSLFYKGKRIPGFHFNIFEGIYNFFLERQSFHGSLTNESLVMFANVLCTYKPKHIWELRDKLSRWVKTLENKPGELKALCYKDSRGKLVWNDRRQGLLKQTGSQVSCLLTGKTWSINDLTAIEGE